MEDDRIVDLYWARDERAIAESERKYGRLLRSVSYACLGNREDAEECANDIYLEAWDAMPTARPQFLGAFLPKITRRISIDRFRRDHRAKRGGNNRIIMASDGDLNVGISSADDLKTDIEGKRNEGTFLSILGFGSGNYRDNTMETLAHNGNGVYNYIDGESEAQKVFGTDLIATLYTVAKDVKLQLTFDPAYVASYRQIGYENRQLSREDFTDDTKDAGEVGAGHQVMVFYELVMTENGQKPDLAENTAFMTLAVRYKAPDGDVSKEDTYSIGVSDRTVPDSDTEFMFCVLEVTMLLHNSVHLPSDGSVTYATVLAKLRGLDLDSHSDRAEFRSLIKAFAG